mmetsp:Transcript_29612/g.90023  ORF Transcript_29612/g.90023 Transcript_29612/m.90023 type:complete len:203 (+) Transcript_29612:1207-1815(+)
MRFSKQTQREVRCAALSSPSPSFPRYSRDDTCAMYASRGSAAASSPAAASAPSPGAWPLLPAPLPWWLPPTPLVWPTPLVAPAGRGCCGSSSSKYDSSASPPGARVREAVAPCAEEAAGCLPAALSDSADEDSAAAACSEESLAWRLARSASSASPGVASLGPAAWRGRLSASSSGGPPSRPRLAGMRESSREDPLLVTVIK